MVSDPAIIIPDGALPCKELRSFTRVVIWVAFFLVIGAEFPLLCQERIRVRMMNEVTKQRSSSRQAAAQVPSYYPFNPSIYVKTS